MSLLIALLLAAGQGAAVWGTAVLLRNLLQLTGRWHRAPVMLGTWLAWFVAAIILYTLAGGEGGLMDGFGMLLMLAALSLAGTLGWTVVWLAMEPTLAPPHHDVSQVTPSRTPPAAVP